MDPIDPKPSISSSVTSNEIPALISNTENLNNPKPSPSNHINLDLVPSTSNYADTSTKLSTSTLPLDYSSTQAVPLGKNLIFYLLPLALMFSKIFLFKFTVHANEPLSLRVNNQAYNPEVVNPRTFSKLFVALAIVGAICIIFLNFNQFDSFDFFFPFIPYIFNSILFPLPIYVGNSALRRFIHSSVKEMF